MKRHRSRDKEGRRGKASSLKSRNERNHLETRRRHPEATVLLAGIVARQRPQSCVFGEKAEQMGITIFEEIEPFS